MDILIRPTSSRSRSLLRDLCDALAQQMIYWGHDVRNPSGNLLVLFGMQRIERTFAHGEGSSRYRMRWQGGVIELHGFCAGWYPDSAAEEGFLFVRNRRRLQSTSGGEPHKPGSYDDLRVGHLAPDELLARIVPFVSWLIAYEEWILDNVAAGYRDWCRREARNLGTARKWLSPEEGTRWLRELASDPQGAGRARPKSRREKVSFSTNRRQFAYL